jgi:molybdopterin converting factor small subunit
MAEGAAMTSTTLARVARLRLFAQAREAAGTGEAVVPGNTVGEVLDAASGQFGSTFEQLLATCRIWVNGDPADRGDVVGDHDEVAVLPPVSGGA